MEIDEALELYRKADPTGLYARANEVCERYYGNRIWIRGLLEFSNYCGRNCLYCGIRRSNARVKRYRLEMEQILAIVDDGYRRGLRTFVLQSGEDHYYSVDDLCHLTERIKEITRGEAALTLSCGIMSRSEYRRLADAGADRYLIRFETSDPDLHVYLRDGITLERRLQTLYDLRECGYEVGSGYMVGLPGETEEIRINNALLCRKFDLDMVGIGPFIPHPDTPLKDSSGGSMDDTLRAVALVRLLLPEANIPATTAVGSIEDGGRGRALTSGANVLMPNITPDDFKKNYLLYPGKICLRERGYLYIDQLNKSLGPIGKEMSLARGDSLSISHSGIAGRKVPSCSGGI